MIKKNTIVKISNHSENRTILLKQRRNLQLEIEKILRKIDIEIFKTYKTTIYFHFSKYFQNIKNDEDTLLKLEDLVAIFISKDLCKNLLKKCYQHDQLCLRIYDTKTEKDILEEILEIVKNLQKNQDENRDLVL